MGSNNADATTKLATYRHMSAMPAVMADLGPRAWVIGVATSIADSVYDPNKKADCFVPAEPSTAEDTLRLATAKPGTTEKTVQKYKKLMA